MNCVLQFDTLESKPAVEMYAGTLDQFKSTNLGQEKKGRIYLFLERKVHDFDVHGFVVQDDGTLREDVESRDYLRLASRSDIASVFNSITTPKKAQAGRNNGRKGGRPKKSPSVGDPLVGKDTI